MADVDNAATAFAERHGSFLPHFDASRNPASPDYRPWTLLRDGKPGAWAGFTADEAITFAASELGTAGD